MAKFRRSECSLGWTDHAFNRLKGKIIDGTMKHKRRSLSRTRRFISRLNDVVFHKEPDSLPF